MAFNKIEELNQVEWIYNVMISFKENDQPIWELYYNFWEKTDKDEANMLLLSSMIKNWGLNVLNNFVEVKWYNTFADYLLILGLHKWKEQVLEELNSLFQLYMEEISEEEMNKRIEDDKKFKENLENEEAAENQAKEEVE